MIRTCEICGGEFKCHPSDKTVTCRNRECRSEKHRRTARKQKKSIKICVICGAKFNDSPSSSRRTCRKAACTIAARKAGAARNPQHLDDMREGIRNSPILQPDERHINAKNWNLIAPNGQQYDFRNLALFIRSNKNLFDNDDIVIRRYYGCRAASQLSKLRPECKGRKLSQWKGWRWA